jgi:hypothetical protein
MSLFTLRLVALFLFAVLTAGCASSPLGKLNASGESGDSILITGHAMLKGKESLLTDPEDIRKITQLINKVQRFRVISKVVRWNFDPSESRHISLQIERNGKSSKVGMNEGQMVIPGDDIVFYGDDLETQAELWSLAMKRLGVDENGKPAEKIVGEVATP